MKYLFDLVIAIVIIGCIYAGSRKGAVRMLILLAGYVAAVAAAVFVSNVASEYIYDNAVKPVVVSALEAKSQELSDEYLTPQKLGNILEENNINLTEEQLEAIIDGSENYSELLTDEKLSAALNNLFTDYCKGLTEAFSGILPNEILDEADRYLRETNMENERKIELLTEERQSFIEIVEEIIRPLMLKTVEAVLFAVTFAAVCILASIISKAAKVIREIPVVRSADSFLGSVLGFLQSLIYIVIINMGVSVFIKFTSNANEYINADIISETLVFKWLYNGTFFLQSLILN